MVGGSYSVIDQEVYVGLELNNFKRQMLPQTQMLVYNQDSCLKVFLGMVIS